VTAHPHVVSKLRMRRSYTYSYPVRLHVVGSLCLFTVCFKRKPGDIAVMWLIPLCIQEVLDSNLGLDTDYSKGVRGFPQSLKANAMS
jgi:hypothetical protein